MTTTFPDAPGWLDRPARWLGHQASLDVPADRLAALATRILPGGRLGEELGGRSLGHPLHPAMTDLPIGCWTSAVTLDLVGGRMGQRAADLLLALGTVSAVPTALAGLADWLRLGPTDRRIGLVHTASNAVATVLFARSSIARLRGHRLHGVTLALAAGTVATFGGYLGGHLAARVAGGAAGPVHHVRAAVVVAETIGSPDEWDEVDRTGG